MARYVLIRKGKARRVEELGELLDVLAVQRVRLGDAATSSSRGAAATATAATTTAATTEASGLAEDVGDALLLTLVPEGASLLTRRLPPLKKAV